MGQRPTHKKSVQNQFIIKLVNEKNSLEFIHSPGKTVI